MTHFATLISPTDLFSGFVKYLSTKLLAEEIYEQEDIDEMNPYDLVCEAIHWCENKVRRDVENIMFELDNNSCSPDVPFDMKDAGNWLGPQSHNGISFIGFIGGGDCEEPVAFIVYHDGIDFRGYVPTMGNSFDIENKAAYVRKKGSAPRDFDIAEMKEDIMGRIQVRN